MNSLGVIVWPTGRAIVLGNLVAPEGAFDIVRIGGSIAALEKQENKTRTEKREKNPSRHGAVWWRRWPIVGRAAKARRLFEERAARWLGTRRGGSREERRGRNFSMLADMLSVV